MGNNAFLNKLAEEKKAYFKAGIESGRQQILDMMSLVLRDPDIMGKDIFGKERLLAVVKGIGDYIDKYELAWQRHDETDYYRQQLDTNLAKAYGEELHDSFLVRYQYAPEFDYTKGKWSK